MKIYSWNVNGIRACVTKTFMNFIKEFDWDIICLQEIRCNPDEIPYELYDFCIKNNIRISWNSCIVKSGYSGTAILSKIPFSNASNKFTYDAMVNEGRIITHNYKGFNLVTAYIPNSKRDFSRLRERLIIEEHMLKYIKSLDNVVYCGDLNAVVSDIDIYNSSLKAPGNSYEERASINKILTSGFTDTFRMLHKEEIKYSWFSNFGNARENNNGWRLDYFIVSENLKSKIKEASIVDYKGSDHLPIFLNLEV